MTPLPFPRTTLALLVLVALLSGCTATTAEPATLTAPAVVSPSVIITRPTSATSPGITTTPPTPTAQIAGASPTGEPTANAESLLPAPIYYLSRDSGSWQIWRAEVDGMTARQITDETSDIGDFAVSPADGSLAFIVGNAELILTDSEGGNRQIVAQTSSYPAELEPYVRGVVWAPDGQSVWFGLEGLQRANADGSQVGRLLQDDPPPFAGGPHPSYTYVPVSFSPDGTTLLVGAMPYPEGTLYALFDPSTSELRMIEDEAAFVCCVPAWTANSHQIVMASDQLVYANPGLFLVDVPSASSQLLRGEPNADPERFGADYFFHSATVADDGTIYALQHEHPEGMIAPEVSAQPLRLVRAPLASASDPTAWEAVGQERFPAFDALWTTDPARSGVLLTVSDAQRFYEQGGDLLWLLTDGSASIPLPLIGRGPQWAPTN